MSECFGLKAEDWELVRRLAIEPLKAEGAQVWVFGSRATGKFRPFSDLDILYSMPASHPLPPGGLSSIREALEESRLPIKVDLVEFVDLAAAFRDEILRTRRLL